MFMMIITMVNGYGYGDANDDKNNDRVALTFESEDETL